jgi:capsular exopolysaccharide synthesis family protein
VDIREYLRIFGRYWWLIVILAVLGGAIGYSTWAFPGLVPYTDREYQSTATLFVATQSGSNVTEAYQNNLFSIDRASSYASLATSEQVAARAVDQLKAPISAGELRGKIVATPVPKTVLLKVGVKDPDPAQAQTYANAVANQLVGLVSELETSRRGGTPAAGAVVVDEANYPTEPLGRGMWIRIALGVAGGLLLGIIVAILAGVFDKRLRGREPVEDVTGSLVIGVLPLDPLRRRVDVADLASDGLYAERLRELRTNLRFTARAHGGNPPKLIAITSPSAEDGRTTTAIDLAAVLTESGRSVVLVDGDMRKSALADRLPLSGPMRDGASQRGLSTVLVGETNLVEALIPGVELDGHPVALLPAGPTPARPGEVWGTDRAGRLLDELAHDFDYVIIDTPPLETYSEGAVIGALSDGALLLARMRRTTSSALRRALRTLQSANVALLGTIVTFEPGHRRQVVRDRRSAADKGRAGTGDGSGNGSRRPGGENEAADSAETAAMQSELAGSARSPRSSRSRHGIS